MKKLTAEQRVSEILLDEFGDDAPGVAERIVKALTAEDELALHLCTVCAGTFEEKFEAFKNQIALRKIEEFMETDEWKEFRYEEVGGVQSVMDWLQEDK